MPFLAQPLLACFLTALLILALRRPAGRIGLIDHPGGRKRHAAAVPLTGGLALTLGFYAALAISFGGLSEFTILLVLMAVLASIGLVDDLVEASARTKLAVQLFAAVLMATWGEHRLLGLGDLFATGPLQLGGWSIPFTVFATVAVVNGINMLDGLDGLAGGVVAAMLGFFALFAFWLAEVDALRVVMLLLGAVVGFLLFNVPHPWRGRQRTFMGDSGSLVLGFAVAWFTIDLTQRPDVPVPPVVMLWVAGVVLFDIFTVTIRRLLRGRSPVAPDRAHIHHLLQLCGMSVTATWALLVAANILLGAIGTIAWRAGMPQPGLFGVYIVFGLAYVALFIRPIGLLRWCRRRKHAKRRLAAR